MWRVYKHTRKDKDYEVYKEALNAATNEVRKAKQNFEHKLAQNVKSDIKSFYAYVRSKQNVRDNLLLFGRSRMIVGHHRFTDELFPAAAILCRYLPK